MNLETTKSDMKITKQRIIELALVSAIATAALTGCNKKGDAISAADQSDKKAGIAAPGIEETKAIAEEGFIYGLPIVMNYAVMNEFAVDTKSSQFKAPFNEINNQHRVATYEGHGGHYAEQRHSLLDALVGSARGADGDLGASSGKGTLLLGAVDRW